MHSFTGDPPAPAQQIAAPRGENLPVPFATAGHGNGARPAPVYGRPLFSSLAHTLTDSRSVARVHEKDRIFSITKNCTSCGTCIAVCPVGNIKMIGKKPAWKYHCELCLACIRTCPAQAIRVGNKRAGGSQSRRTGITPADQERQREKYP
jgi:ferredoxin